jgi:ankyrin repeat protein
MRSTLGYDRKKGLFEETVSAFIDVACVSPEAHRSGTLEEANHILAQHPHVATANIYTASLLGDEGTVRTLLSSEPANATRKGGPRRWDALTHLCFSRYLRLDRTRSEAFVRTARALLDAGADANTGFIEMIDHPNPRPLLNAAIYGAAAIAQHAGLTRLLLERGADPNDEETAYHVIETRDNTVLKILLESGKFNANSMSTLLLRKCDWHDAEGLRLVLQHGGDPNWKQAWGNTALHQAVIRDNDLEMIGMLLDHGGDPTRPNHEGNSAIVVAARRGRAPVLDLVTSRGFPLSLSGVDALIAACARDQKDLLGELAAEKPQLRQELIVQGGTRVAEFAGTGNLAGVRNLLDLGVSVNAVHRQGDLYFDVTSDSTALHIAAWRARHEVVGELIMRGAAVNARDSKGRTALQLAVKAAVDSYWIDLRSPASVRALLKAGASSKGIDLPCGYSEIDRLLQR